MTHVPKNQTKSGEEERLNFCRGRKRWNVREIILEKQLVLIQSKLFVTRAMSCTSSNPKRWETN